MRLRHSVCQGPPAEGARNCTRKFTAYMKWQTYLFTRENFTTVPMTYVFDHIYMTYAWTYTYNYHLEGLLRLLQASMDIEIYIYVYEIFENDTFFPFICNHQRGGLLHQLQMQLHSGNYRVAKTHMMPYLYRSFSAKETYIYWLFCGK